MDLKATLIRWSFHDFEHKAAPQLHILNQFTAVGAVGPDLFDTLGLLILVLVSSAALPDRDGGRQVLAATAGRLPRLRRVWADQSYAGMLVEWVQLVFAFVLDIVRRPKQQQGFEVLPKRWIVERTLGWFNRYRRPSKDYERRADVSEGMVYIASIRRMLRWLDRHHNPT